MISIKQIFSPPDPIFWQTFDAYANEREISVEKIDLLIRAGIECAYLQEGPKKRTYYLKLNEEDARAKQVDKLLEKYARITED